MDFVETCRKIIAIDSTPANGTEEVVKFVSSLCQSAGLVSTFQEGVINGVAQANIISRYEGKMPPTEILFQSHLDTIEPGSYSLWSETDLNPFNATIRNNKIFGLGAVNSKLDYICKLRAIKEIGPKKMKTPLVLVGTYGEEIGMWGARKIIQEEVTSAKLAFIGEATDMQLVYASNGIAVIDFLIPFSEQEKEYRSEHEIAESTATHSRIFRGKAAHSSSPDLGENAILKMVRYLDELPEAISVLTVDGGTSHNVVPDQAFLEVDTGRAFNNGIGSKIIKLVNELESLATSFINYSAPDFNPPHPTFNIGVIRTHEDGIQIITSLRLTPTVSEDVLHSWRSRIKQFCSKIGANVRVREIKAPSRTAPDSPFIRECMNVLQTVGGPLKYATKSGTNESSVYSSRGIDCVVIGPGESMGNSHSPNEHVSFDQLELAVQFYKGVIEKFCI